MYRLRLVQFSMCTLIMMFGCNREAGNMWEENQTGAQYKYRSAPSSKTSSASFPVEGSDEESTFFSLNEEDLQSQFSEFSITSTHDLGEGEIPKAEEFHEPQGSLVSLLSPIFFATDQYTVHCKEYFETVHRIAAYLKSHPGTSLIIEGYCDERGPEAYNLALGMRRANYVRSLLLKEGVSTIQLHTLSFGKEKPFALGHTSEDWAKNRRAHFRVHCKS